MRLLSVLAGMLVPLLAFGQAVDYRALKTTDFTTNVPSPGYVGVNTNVGSTIYNAITNVAGTTNYWTTNAADVNAISNIFPGFVYLPTGIRVGANVSSVNNSIQVDGGRITDSQWTPNTVLKSDGGLTEVSIPIGTGSLTNNGAGVMGWYPYLGNTITTNTDTGITNEVLSMVTNSINQNARIGPGTLNQVAKFTNPTNVGNSIVTETATNQWQWRSLLSPSAWTNQITNAIYGRDDGTGNSWDRLSIISASGLGSAYNEILGETTLSGPNGNAPLLLHNAWIINHGTVSSSGNTPGFMLPKQDNTFNIGSGSLRVKQGFAGAGGWTCSDTATWSGPGQYGSGTYAWVFTTGGIEAFRGASGFIAQFQNSTVDGNTGLAMGPNYIGWSSGAGGGTTANWTTFLRQGNEAHTLMMGTNNSGSTIPAPQTLTAIEGSGTDKHGADLLLLGGRSTGLGTNGAVRIQTVQPAAATSSALNVTTNERAYFASAAETIVTNSASGIFTITLPTSLKHLSILVYATTEIDNGTDLAIKSETFIISAVNKAGTVTTHVSSPAQSDSLATGAASISSTTWTATVASQTITVNLNCVTAGIAATTSKCEWQLYLNNNDRVAITPL